MVTIKITIEDEAGKQIGEPQAYSLEIGNGTLAEIETAVEKLKRKSLPEIEHQLLAHDQAELVKKKVN